MTAKIVFDNLKDKELIKLINLSTPFYVEFIDSNTKDGKKKAYNLKGYYGARLNPFVELVDDEDKLIKVFYSEEENACYQLIKYLNENFN